MKNSEIYVFKTNDKPLSTFERISQRTSQLFSRRRKSVNSTVKKKKGEVLSRIPGKVSWINCTQIGVSV
jgi:hypothetical protein